MPNHLLGDYLRSMLAVLLAQFSRKGFPGGMQGVVRLADKSATIQALSAMLFPYLTHLPFRDAACQQALLHSHQHRSGCNAACMCLSKCSAGCALASTTCYAMEQLLLIWYMNRVRMRSYAERARSYAEALSTEDAHAGGQGLLLDGIGLTLDDMRKLARWHSRLIDPALARTSAYEAAAQRMARRKAIHQDAVRQAGPAAERVSTQRV